MYTHLHIIDKHGRRQTAAAAAAHPRRKLSAASPTSSFVKPCHDCLICCGFSYSV